MAVSSKSNGGVRRHAASFPLPLRRNQRQRTDLVYSSLSKQMILTRSTPPKRDEKLHNLHHKIITTIPRSNNHFGLAMMRSRSRISPETYR